MKKHHGLTTVHVWVCQTGAKIFTIYLRTDLQYSFIVLSTIIPYIRALMGELLDLMSQK